MCLQQRGLHQEFLVTDPRSEAIPLVLLDGVSQIRCRYQNLHTKLIRRLELAEVSSSSGSQPYKMKLTRFSYSSLEMVTVLRLCSMTS